jgi:uncharacterized membrane protein YkgB
MMLNRLVSLNKNISYIVTMNLLGDIISKYYKDTILEKKDIDKIGSKFRRIATATSLLNFDNIKFLMYEEDNLKHVIINNQELSIIVGLSSDTSISDFLHILGEFMNMRENQLDTRP